MQIVWLRELKKASTLAQSMASTMSTVTQFTFDQVDSLEDWVAIKEHPFFEKEKHSKLSFIVAYNEVEEKIAVTAREAARVASDTEIVGWSELYSFRDLRCIHEQLCLVHPSLGPYLPELPQEYRGLMAMFSTPEDPPENVSELIEMYLKIALEICGQSLLVSTLFEIHTYEEYFENVSELKKRQYDEAVNRAEEELRSILFLRDGSINMLDMSEMYSLEDETLFKLNVALARLYNYQLQPFLDMREVSYNKVQEAKRQLKNPDIGDRVKAEYAAMFTEWQAHYSQALDMIQEVYIKYYTKSTEILEDVKARLLCDKESFGKSAFVLSGRPRLERVEEDLSLERQQLLHSEKKRCENQRDKLKQEIASLEEGPDVSQRLGKLEKSVYDWQLKVYDTYLRITEEEEHLQKFRLQVIQNAIKESEEEVVFYDAIEDEDELSPEDEPTGKVTDPRVLAIKQKLSGIYRRRANIRNKRKKIIQDRTEKKKKKAEEEEKKTKKRPIVVKKEKLQDDEQKNQERIQEERRKTLARLRQYRMKYPSRPPLRPTRSKRQPGQSMPMVDSGAYSSTFTMPEAGNGADTPDHGSLPVVPTPFPRAPPSTPANYSPSSEIPPPPPPPPPPSTPATFSPSRTPPPPPPPPPPVAPQAPMPPPLPVPPKQSPWLKESKPLETVKENVQPTEEFHIDAKNITEMKSKLRRAGSAEPHAKQKPKSVDPVKDMMALIRQGVNLHHVQEGDKEDERMKNSIPSSGEDHYRTLQDALTRINKHANASSDEEDGVSDGEFDD